MAEVLSVQLPEEQSYFASAPLRRSASQVGLLVGSQNSYGLSRKSSYATPDYRNQRAESISSSAPSSPQTSHINLSRSCSSLSTPSSSFSLDTAFDDDDESEDDGLSFANYANANGSAIADDSEEDEQTLAKSNGPASPSNSDPQSLGSPEPFPVMAEDDTAVRHQPSQHVDYLSYEWQEEDIWASWRHIVSKRNVYGQRSRLENASWRSWAKSKYKLRTVSPETLNWLKDCDVTWLYGPLQPASRTYASHASEPTSHISKNNSFLNSSKKPILKKRSMSEVMLQRSISASSLLKQAAAAVEAQQDSLSPDAQLRGRPFMGRAASDFEASTLPSRTISRDATELLSSRSSSGMQTPGEQAEKKHIRFDNKVEQCIAVDCKDGEYDEDDDDWMNHGDESSDDEGVVMMKRSRRRPLNKPSRATASTETKIIEKLEPTTLKYRTESPDEPESKKAHLLGFFGSSGLISCSSDETLRPAFPSKNFLLGEEDDDDEDEEDVDWQPSGAFAHRRDSLALPRLRKAPEKSGDAGMELRRTASGMFMPYEEEEEEPVQNGLMGKVVETVNTARDIAHVIWNVGWRR